MFGSTPWRRLLFKASLTEKLIAWVGKYLRTFAQLPLQSEDTPYYLTHLEKQSPMPLYGFYLNLGLFSWVCKRSLTLSMGAARVLAMAPDVPPRMKSLRSLVDEFFYAVDPCAIQNNDKIDIKINT